jgi:EAL domain-containing protein (putative c-di-GMP-specific phosphodiesterase class I)
VSVSVNISARDFRSGDVPGMVADALEASALEPHRLELEVTETALIEERGAAVSILSALAAQGIGIALDDFGTGYSSLSYLQALPFSKLKVDRSFVMDITTNPRSLTLLSNVAQLGKDINLTVTAEGVETEEQLALITRHTKVDQIQGYLFGVPLPRREVGELIARMGSGLMAEPAMRKQG